MKFREMAKVSAVVVAAVGIAVLSVNLHSEQDSVVGLAAGSGAVAGAFKTPLATPEATESDSISVGTPEALGSSTPKPTATPGALRTSATPFPTFEPEVTPGPTPEATPTPTPEPTATPKPLPTIQPCGTCGGPVILPQSDGPIACPLIVCPQNSL